MDTLFLRIPMIWRVNLLPMLVAFLTACVASIISLPQEASAAWQSVTQPVVIVVRDCAGNPMMGVPLLIKIAGPPIEDHDQCVTGQDGTCTVNLLPDSYVIQFVQGWRGRPFIPIEEQSGFGLGVIESDEVQYFTLAVAERDGQLVPVWDMSRDPAKLPEPFLPSFNDEDPLASLNLGPLSTDPNTTSQPAVSDTTPTAQIVVDVVGSGAAAPTAGAVIPTPAATGQTPNILARGILGLVIAFIFVALLILLLFVILRRPDQKKEQ